MLCILIAVPSVAKSSILYFNSCSPGRWHQNGRFSGRFGRCRGNATCSLTCQPFEFSIIAALQRGLGGRRRHGCTEEKETLLSGYSDSNLRFVKILCTVSGLFSVCFSISYSLSRLVGGFATGVKSLHSDRAFADRTYSLTGVILLNFRNCSSDESLRRAATA